jgi:5-methylcytosine-specific restriction endonuclease McrA
VAGGPWSAINSLKKAVEVHGATCFYCSTPLTKDTATIDHVEGQTGEMPNAIQNLVSACKPCNAKKGHFPIDAFKPEAGREWLQALHAQVEERLRKLG